MVCSVCVCKILHVDLYMIQRNVFKVYRMDDQIWYTSETLHFQNRGKRGPYWVIFSFLNGDSMAKNCCRRPISLVSRCSSNIFRTNGFSQPFSGKSPNIFPTFSQHFPNMFPTFSQHFPNIFPTCSQHVPNIFPTLWFEISLSKVRLPFSNEMLRSSLLPGPKGNATTSRGDWDGYNMEMYYGWV